MNLDVFCVVWLHSSQGLCHETVQANFRCVFFIVSTLKHKMSSSSSPHDPKALKNEIRGVFDRIELQWRAEERGKLQDRWTEIQSAKSSRTIPKSFPYGSIRIRWDLLSRYEWFRSCCRMVFSSQCDWKSTDSSKVESEAFWADLKFQIFIFQVNSEHFRDRNRKFVISRTWSFPRSADFFSG